MDLDLNGDSIADRISSTDGKRYTLTVNQSKVDGADPVHRLGIRLLMSTCRILIMK